MLVSYLGLRLKPDKSKLEDLINKVKEIDLSKYTKESVNNLNLALATASEILANDDATQKDIDKALSDLEIAKANLVANSNESNNSNGSNNSNNNTNKPNSNGNKGNSNLTNSLPKTGAVVSSTIIIILAVVVVGAGVVMMKKKKTDK